MESVPGPPSSNARSRESNWDSRSGVLPPARRAPSWWPLCTACSASTSTSSPTGNSGAIMRDPTLSNSAPSAADLAPLVARAAAGDQAAWNELVDRFGPLVWTVARAHHLTPADADDVFQTTWLRLVQNLDRIGDPARLAGWLTTAVHREAVRVRRRSAREVTAATENVKATLPADDPAATYESQERNEQVWRAFAQLPERCQQLLRLSIVRGETMSYAEVSAALCMPVGSIGPPRARCLARLRKLLAVVVAPEEGAAVDSPGRFTPADLSDADLVGLLRSSHATADPIASDVLEQSRRLLETARRTDTPE